MTISLEQLKALLASDEDEHLEFKEATKNFDSRLLAKYCAALANEGGGEVLCGRAVLERGFEFRKRHPLLASAELPTRVLNDLDEDVFQDRPSRR